MEKQTAIFNAFELSYRLHELRQAALSPIAKTAVEEAAAFLPRADDCQHVIGQCEACYDGL